MASTPKQMKATGFIPNATSTAYTVGAKINQAIVKEFFVCNQDAVNTQTFTVYFVPSGGAVGAATTMYKSFTLQAGESVRFSSSTVLLPGDTIHWVASAASTITGLISGIEYT